MPCCWFESSGLGLSLAYLLPTLCRRCPHTVHCALMYPCRLAPHKTSMLPASLRASSGDFVCSFARALVGRAEARRCRAGVPTSGERRARWIGVVRAWGRAPVYTVHRLWPPVFSSAGPSRRTTTRSTPWTRPVCRALPGASGFAARRSRRAIWDAPLLQELPVAIRR